MAMMTRSNALPIIQVPHSAVVKGPDFASALPVEILGLCFTFLPDLHACFTVSHVSRFWRDTALAYPALWSNIELGHFKQKTAIKVLWAALERSGQYPVEFQYRVPSDNWPVEGEILRAVAAHMHHIRRLRLPLSVARTDANGAVCFARAAPLLEELSCCGNEPSQLAPDFLDGCAGNLRSLTLPCPIFPLTCPALATVTRLTTSASLLHDDGHSRTFASFARLFDLCPGLSDLYIVELDPEHAHLLPSSPAPDSLLRLTLTGAYDLLALLPHFQGASTQTVKLRMPATMLHASVPFRDLEHAVELELAEPFGLGSMHLTIRRPLAEDQRRTEIVFPYATAWHDESYKRIANYLVNQRLARIERMTLPLPALSRCDSVFAQCASLHEVRIVAQDDYGVFPWQSLHRLPSLPTSVTSVVIEVSYGPTSQPKALDVVLLLEHLRQAFSADLGAANAAGVGYVVRGFPAELLPSTDKNIMPRLTFESAPTVNS